jgi:hybrid cluster-associated redox disulfide protein
MDAHPILSFSILNRKISDLLDEYPQLVRVFLKHHAACIGCVFASFCTLRDALRFYELDPEVVLPDLQQAIYAIPCEN